MPTKVEEATITPIIVQGPISQPLQKYIKPQGTTPTKAYEATNQPLHKYKSFQPTITKVIGATSQHLPKYKDLPDTVFWTDWRVAIA